jgi:transposase
MKKQTKSLSKKSRNSKRKFRKTEELQHINANAAGVDIGSRSHFVAIPSDRDKNHVREFDTFTTDLHKLADWLSLHGITTVAMESTGVYWIPLFELLEDKGFEVHLVNAHDIKNVPGRKTDILDCQWIQQLHTYGLLRGSFRPNADICKLRAIRRQRDRLIEMAASHIQRMQKSLTEMNVLLHNVISDIVGASGLKIIKAIIAGESDAVKLADLCDGRCKRSKEDIVKALMGNFKEEHVFSLGISLDLYNCYQNQINVCNDKIEEILSSFNDTVDIEKKPLKKLSSNRKSRNRIGQNTFSFDLRSYLYSKSGVDLTLIHGISESTAFTILSEIGFSVDSWPTSKHFVSWLGLCPNNKKSGGKIISSKTKPCSNKITNALKMSAMTLGRTETAIGAYYRRLKSRKGAPKAIVATAHKLARIIYNLLATKNEFVSLSVEYYEEKYRSRIIKNMNRRAKDMGYQLTPVSA